MSITPQAADVAANLPLGRTHLSVEEFRTSLGICRTVAYRLVRDNRVRSFRVGKRIFIPIAELSEFPARMAE
jgi:hypothetical protein